MSGAGEVDGLLRELAPQVLGVLVRRYGKFDLCEDAVQEALLAAAVQWPADGVPEKPYGVVTAAILAERGIGDADDVHERAGESLLRWVERDLLR